VALKNPFNTEKIMTWLETFRSDVPNYDAVSITVNEVAIAEQNQSLSMAKVRMFPTTNCNITDDCGTGDDGGGDTGQNTMGCPSIGC